MGDEGCRALKSYREALSLGIGLGTRGVAIPVAFDFSSESS